MAQDQMTFFDTLRHGLDDDLVMLKERPAKRGGK